MKWNFEKTRKQEKIDFIKFSKHERRNRQKK